MRYWFLEMIHQWFQVGKTAAMCISMSSDLPLSGAEDMPLEPSSDWLTALE